MRRDGGNHHDKWGLERIVCASQCTTTDEAGATPDPACKNSNMRSSSLNQAGCIPEFSYLLISSISFPSPSLISHSSPQLSDHCRTQC